ncbi:hypothetical protein CEP52_004696 [Fusarium oligoseptatum]|uniref:Uncharacterized protein n=1 Tax=Fusarium oligoseptatum TaxID=2604345 RepID=A0A428U2D9_9HYPO|nr:hypothetical protein CEP52_004696 [Fusarium oligoseptatum]
MGFSLPTLTHVELEIGHFANCPSEPGPYFVRAMAVTLGSQTPTLHQRLNFTTILRQDAPIYGTSHSYRGIKRFHPCIRLLPPCHPGAQYGSLQHNSDMLLSAQLNKCSRYLHTLDLAREAGHSQVEVETLGPDSSKKHSKLHKVNSPLCDINVVASFLVYRHSDLRWPRHKDRSNRVGSLYSAAEAGNDVQAAGWGMALCRNQH